MVQFDTVYLAARARVALSCVLTPPYVRKFWDLVGKLACGRFDLKGLRVEKLQTSKGKIYSARLNLDIRVIFSMFYRGHKRSLVIWDADHHDDAYRRAGRMNIPQSWLEPGSNLEPVAFWEQEAHEKLGGQEADNEELVDGLVLFEIPSFVLAEPSRFSSYEKNIDRYLRLTDEQKEIIAKNDRAFIVKGSAGTGKTTLALFHALNCYEQNPCDEVLFFTYQQELACVCRCYKVNLLGGEDNKQADRLKVFSYLQFCRDCLLVNLDAKKTTWIWIDRQASLKHLDNIIQSKPRWARCFSARQVYSYIYSILKGRFVPGTDRLPQELDEYRRIFKGYGTANLEPVMEIFQLYQARLKSFNQKDEADLIAYCYQNIKDRGGVSGQSHATWIVIDEVQDFTELEWKSILLFWENKCRPGGNAVSFPFLSGDRNQNISFSGFRWQEVDAYIENILKKMHRPRSIARVQLRDNFRNSLEIFQLGQFLRQCAQSCDDLGLAPRFSTSKPYLVVGCQKDFISFLQQLAPLSPPALPAPLVVLCEDENELQSIQDKLPADDGLFLMSLRKSKGMEFEDCILYRPFKQAGNLDAKAVSEDAAARTFDLWYMAVTRARKHLLIYLTHEDWQDLKKFFDKKLDQLLPLVDLKTDEALTALTDFYNASEKYIPNYNMIFLERVKAEQAWDAWQKGESSGTADKLAVAYKEKALKLWKKCRDWESLGRALFSLSQYALALPYLTAANLPAEAAACLEKTGDYAAAANLYEENQYPADAARCFELAGQPGRAAELFYAAGNWQAAARNFASSGDSAAAVQCFEKAGDWLEAAEACKLKGQWLKAAELYQKSRRYEDAARMYLLVKDKLDAARCYGLADLPEKAGRLLESLNRFAEAAKCYEQAGDYDRACILYSKAGCLKEVAYCAEKAGKLKTAAAAYERMKNWAKAGDLYLNCGLKLKASECFEYAQDWRKALPLLVEIEDWYRLGRCWQKLDDLPKAIDFYLRADAFNEAGWCLEKANQWQEAARCFLKAGNRAAAAAAIARLGGKIEAARLYLLEKQVDAACRLAAKVNAADPLSQGKKGDLRLDLAAWAESQDRPDLAAAVYEQLGHFTLAGHRFKQAGMLAKAGDCFARDGKPAAAADLYQLDMQYAKAGDCFKLARQWQKAAECYEKANSWGQAAEMYRLAGDGQGVKRCRSSARWL